MNYSMPFILLLAKYFLSYAAITKHWYKRQGRISGGHDAHPHSHPYLVSLQNRILWARVHKCGGALLNKYWVLSAGHCMKENWLTNWLPVDAVAGAHALDKIGPEAQVLPVSHRIIHPQYGEGAGPHDIAVLKTSQPFTFTNAVQPVHLPKVSEGHPDILTLVGWGILKTTFFFPDLPEKLQEVSVTVIPYEECYKAVEALKQKYESNPLDKEANICTGPLTGGVAGCSGDSGGPLVQYMSNQRFYDNDPMEENNYGVGEEIGTNKAEDDDENRPVVLGVVSWGYSPCGVKGAPTVYTKVSRYVDFINLYIKD